MYLKSPDEFKNIRYYPTIVLYNDGEEELRIESGISLKLPEDWKEQLNEHIDLLLSQTLLSTLSLAINRTVINTIISEQG